MIDRRRDDSLWRAVEEPPEPLLLCQRLVGAAEGISSVESSNRQGNIRDTNWTGLACGRRLNYRRIRLVRLCVVVA